MTWARFDDRYYDNPKVVSAGHRGRDLHMASIIWVAGNAPQTGRIPTPLLAHLCKKADVAVTRANAVAATLVAVGLWDVEEGHYILHDFETYLPKPVSSALRLARAEAGRKGGLGKALATQKPGNGEAKVKQSPLAKPSLTRASRPVPLGSEVTSGVITSTLGGIETSSASEDAQSLELSLNTSSADRDARSLEFVDPTDANLQAFIIWQNSTGKTSARFLPRRRKLLMARRKEGYTQAEIEDALRGHANDPWPERKLHLDMQYLIGDGQTLEKFRDLYRNGRPVTALFKPNGTVDRAQQRAQVYDQIAAGAKQLTQGETP